MSYRFGIEGLDKLYGGALYPGSLIVIAGHPGAGKTTFASKICYANALNGYKTLYLTLQEDRDKLYRILSNLGLNMLEVERRDLFRFVKIPISREFKETADWLLNLVSEVKPNIIVIDSINALMQHISQDEHRAWLQNYFSQLPREINGLAILIAELPFGKEELGLGSIEFVADAIFILKHWIENNRLVRVMEIRKARGAPISVAEIPFNIVPDKGLEIYPPPMLEEVPRQGRKVDIPLKTLVHRGFDHLHEGFTIYVTYPADARSWIPYGILMSIAIVNDLRMLVIPYSHSSKDLRHHYMSMFRQLGLDDDEGEYLIKRYILFKSINPFAYSISQLYAYETELINKYRRRADVIVFPDVDVLMYHHRRVIGLYIDHLMNQINVLRKYRLITIRGGAYIDYEIHRINSMLSDLIFRVTPTYRAHGRPGIRLYMWRRLSRTPYILTQEEIDELLKEINTILKEHVAKHMEKHGDKK